MEDDAHNEVIFNQLSTVYRISSFVQLETQNWNM